MIIRLYFLQPMVEGLGSFDIFYAERLNDTWQKWSDLNLGSKINTSGAEKSLVLDSMIYKTTNTNSDGCGDIRGIRINSKLKYSKKTLKSLILTTLGQSHFLLGSENEKWLRAHLILKQIQ